MKLYPNQASNTICIESTEKIEGVDVYNGPGVQVGNIYFDNTSQIDTSTLADGLYFFHIKTQNSIYNPKIIIQH